MRNANKKLLLTLLSLIVFLWVIWGVFYLNFIVGDLTFFVQIFSDFDETTLVFLIFPFLLIWLVIFQLLRVFLWKIDINLYWNNFRSGDTIQWDINLKLNKSVEQWSLCVYLRWYRWAYSIQRNWYRRRNSYRNNRRYLEKIFENKLTLVDNQYFEKGIKNYNFSFELPYSQDNDDRTGQDNTSGKYDTQWLSDRQVQLATKFSKMMHTFTHSNHDLYNLIRIWKIEVTLEKKWIDLHNEIKIGVNKNNT